MREQVLDDQYWHFLGLKPGASAAEISAARNRLAKLYHPDRGGTAEDMARLNEAFEIVTGKRKASSTFFEFSGGERAVTSFLFTVVKTWKGRLDPDVVHLIRDRESADLEGLKWVLGDIVHQANDVLAERDQLKTEVGSLRAELDHVKAHRQQEQQRPAKMGHEVNCASCGRPFVPSRSDAKTCSNTCRQALHRSRNGCNGSAQAATGPRRMR